MYVCQVIKMTSGAGMIQAKQNVVFTFFLESY